MYNLRIIEQENFTGKYEEVQKLLGNAVIENKSLEKEKKQLIEKVNINKHIDINKINFYIHKGNSYSNLYEEKLNTYNFKYNKIKRIIGHEFNNKAIKSKIKNLDNSINKSKFKLGLISNIEFSGEIQDFFRTNKDIEKEILNLKKKSDEYNKVTDKLNAIYENAKNIIEKNISYLFNTSLMNDFYKKIDPHPIMNNIKFKLKFNNDDKPELEILVDDGKQEQYLPEWYFSSAQLNVVALSTFLGRASSLEDAPVNTIFIDDPIGHFDDMNIIAFVDLLRSLVEKREKQIIVSTHDEVVFNLMKRKLSDKFYKSKFIELKYTE